MFRRIVFCLPLTLLLVTVAEAQQSAKILRIGFLERSTVSGSAALLAAFREELSKLGWVEGKNFVIESRFADQDIERLPDLAAELVRLRVDVIVTGGAGPTRSAKRVTSTIPIVMAQGPDPVGNGFVVSLARPGGNVTGLSALSNDLATKRLEVLKETVPTLTRVGIFLPTPGDSLQTGLAQKELKLASLALKLNLEEIKAPPNPKGLEIAFQTAKEKQVGAIMTNDARTFLGQRKQIIELAGKHRLPAIYYQSEFVDEGGLMSYGADFGELYRRAAHYVDRVLKGTKPADLPVEQPTKFELVINLKAARQIGLKIPPNVLARADRVIR